MSYCTRYSIFDKKTGEEWKNCNSSCFAEFTSQYFDKKYDFDKNSERYIEVYVQNNNKCKGIPNDIESKEYLINWWTEELIKAGFPMKLELKKIERQSKITYNSIIIMPLDNYYIWTLNFNEYENKAHIKFALYFLRYLYEENENIILDKSYEYQKLYPEATGFELFQFMHMFYSVLGHNFFSYFPPIYSITSKEFHDKLVCTWNNYTNNERYEFISLVRRKKDSGIYEQHSPDKIKNLGFIKDMNWENYQKIINPNKISEKVTKPKRKYTRKLITI